MPLGVPPQNAQYPRINFPGAEFFNLSPNASALLGPRLTKNAGGTNTSVPANNAGTLNIAVVPLIPSFGYGDAIFIEQAYAMVTLGDATGELFINAARLALGSGGNFLLDLAVPLAVSNNPTNTMMFIQDRDRLIHFDDIQAVGFAPNRPLDMDIALAMANHDSTNPHSFNIFGVCIFHVLKGLVT